MKPDCRPCGVGIECPERNTTRRDLTLLPGFWRTDADSLDIRRCPDASVNCSDSVCEDSASGCRGRSDPSAYCADGLTGPFW